VPKDIDATCLSAGIYFIRINDKVKKVYQELNY